MPEIQRYPGPSEQIAAYVREQIDSGDLAPGDQVPTVDRLSADWGVSRVTANRALRLLRDAGLVEVGPRGTYVLPADERPTDREDQS